MTTKTVNVQQAAALMRLQRKVYAKRLRDARRAVQLGHPQGQQRLAKLLELGQPAPNPDREASCLKALARATEDYSALVKDVDLETVAAEFIIRPAFEKIQLYTALSEAART